MNARKYGAFAKCTPNRNADERYNRKAFTRGRELAYRFEDNKADRRERRIEKELEAMKNETD